MNTFIYYITVIAYLAECVARALAYHAQGTWSIPSTATTKKKRLPFKWFSFTNMF
jgi:hypothetical protein